MIAANLWCTLCAVVVGNMATPVDSRPAFPGLPSWRKTFKQMLIKREQYKADGDQRCVDDVCLSRADENLLLIRQQRTR